MLAKMWIFASYSIILMDDHIYIYIYIAIHTHLNKDLRYCY